MPILSHYDELNKYLEYTKTKTQISKTKEYKYIKKIAISIEKDMPALMEALRIIETKVYSFNELNDQAKENAINNIRDLDHDFAEWAVDDCSLFEPIEVLLGKDYSFPLFRNNRKDIYFDIDRDNFLECDKAIEITNDAHFFKWLNIPKRLANKVDYNIHTSNYRNSSTTIEFDKREYFNITDKENITLDLAMNKFESHIEDVLNRIKTDIEYQYSDEGIIDTIEGNDYEFTTNGELI